MDVKRPDEARAILLGSGWFGKERAAVFEEPDSVLTFHNGKVITGGGKKRCGARGLLELLEKTLDGECFGVGFFGYEFFHSLLPGFRASSKLPDGFPDACFAFFNSPEIFSPGDLSGVDKGAPEPGCRMRRTIQPGRFMRMVDAIREYIRRGDVYQVNISQMFEFPFRWNPEGFMHRLYSVQPVPFACCMEFGKFSLISGSMELFLKKSGRRITTGPIKGTRPRGGTPEDDEKMREELRSSEKDRAESVMIVDLMRNDLGRVCEFGSIEVIRLFDVESYSTLHQMVSNVSGVLRDGVSLGDVIAATFPPGSVTGAPKVRALEIIEELEPHRRGPYCGAICLFLPNGDFVMSVGIRVVGAQGKKGYYWAGGGITWGSVPQAEYAETLVKAGAVSKAIGAELS